MSFSARTLNTIGFFACCGLMAYAYYAQFQLGLEPCPLCIFQRIGVIVLGVIFLVAALHSAGRSGRRVYAALVSIAALGGAAVAGWHIYLQNLPPEQVPACGPGLNYMLEVFSLGETLEMVFTGSGECANVDWSLLGLSMPAWVLIAFVVLGAFGAWTNLRRR